MKCRFCNTTLHDEFIDLGNAPPSNSFLEKKQIDEPEFFYPLRLYVCKKCFLVQISEYKKSQDIFSDQYIYFSSFSTTWVEHARQYVDMAVNRFGLTGNSTVIEIASNDGYLLQFFKQKNIPCLGIEPAKSTAREAEKKGIKCISEFFGAKLAEKLEKKQKADLLLGNNVLAHVPDINDFVNGLKILLAPDGCITMEFPHLMRLIEQNQFDTIYHEHFSYFSLHTVMQIFKDHGLTIFDVEELPTHGGSLRIFAGHNSNPSQPVSGSINRLLQTEYAHGMTQLECYSSFQAKADKVKNDLLAFLLEQCENKKTVAAYGAAAKGNTLLNYCGIKKDLIDFVVDASPHKQGTYLPGSHIPVVSEDRITKAKPDFIIVLPWNIQTEIIKQLQYIYDWGAKFVIPIPELVIRGE